MRGPLNSIKKTTTKTLCLSSLFIQFKCERNGSSHIAAVGGTHELVARGWGSNVLVIVVIALWLCGNVVFVAKYSPQISLPNLFFFSKIPHPILFYSMYLTLNKKRKGEKRTPPCQEVRRGEFKRLSSHLFFPHLVQKRATYTLITIFFHSFN